MLLATLGLAAALTSPVEAARERIAIAAGVKCPAPTGDEILVCGRASERDKYLLPFPVTPNPASPKTENVYAERKRFANIGKWDEPSVVGPAGKVGYTLAEIDNWATYSGYKPLLERFGGPDIVYTAKPRP